MSHHKLTYVPGTQVCVDQHFLNLPSARCCDRVSCNRRSEHSRPLQTKACGDPCVRGLRIWAVLTPTFHLQSRRGLWVQTAGPNSCPPAYDLHGL